MKKTLESANNKIRFLEAEIEGLKFERAKLWEDQKTKSKPPNPPDTRPVNGTNCFYCGISFETAVKTKDHFIPVSKGGHTHRTNIILACLTCNNKKADRLPTTAEVKAFLELNPGTSLHGLFRHYENIKAVESMMSDQEGIRIVRRPIQASRTSDYIDSSTTH